MARRAAAVVAVGALVVGVVAAITAPSAIAGDPGAPSVTSYKVVPSAVDVTGGPATVTAILRVVDTSGGGFKTGSLTLTTGANNIAAVTFNGNDRVDGNAQGGTYDVEVTIPQTAVAGTYNASITVTDSDNNTSGAVTNNSSPLTVTKTTDSTAPVLVGTISATPSTSDFTHGGSQDVVYSAHLTDNAAGVASATITLKDPDNNPMDLPLDRTAGSPTDGTWTTTWNYSSFDTLGAWTISKLVAKDGANNTLTKTTGLGGTETLTQTPDPSAATITSMQPTPSAINTTTSDKTVIVAVSASDPQSGVANGDIVYQHNGEEVFGSFFGDPTSGTPENGVWDVELDFPARSADGTWTLESADVTNNQGGQTLYDADDEPLPPAGNIAVTTSADSTAPTITSFSVGPSLISPEFGDAQYSGHVGFTDDSSGVTDVQITLTDPSSAPTTRDFFPDETNISGTVTNGTLNFVDELPSPAHGQWHVSNVAITDLAGHTHNYTAAQLPAGSVTAFTIDDGTHPDTATPVVTSVQIAPTSVNTSSGPQNVTVTLGYNDPDTASSGVTGGSLTLSSPSGNNVLSFNFSAPASGDLKTGTFTDTESLGKFVESGTWTINDVELSDFAGHDAFLSGGDVATELGHQPPTLSVTAAIDTTPPTLDSFTGPTTANVTNGDPITFHVTAHDNAGGSGLDSVRVDLTGPGGLTAFDFGSFNAGSSDVDVFVPQFNSTGQWNVTTVTVTDALGHDHAYPTASLPAGSTTAVQVTGTPDTAPPAQDSLSFTPSPVDTTSGPVQDDVLVHLTDAASGVDSAELTVSSPHGTQTLHTFLQRINGTPQNGWWQGTLSFPQYVDPGAWIVGPLDLTDAAGNDRELLSGDLGGAGTLQVTGPPDNTPPTLTGLAIAPASFNTSTADQTVTFTVTATDGQSGVNGVDLAVSSPSGNVSDLVTLHKTGGTPANATYTGTTTVAKFSETGTWTVDSANVSDVYGNSHVYNHAQLTGTGIANSFTVTGTQDTTPPSLGSFTFSPAAADVSAGSITLHGTASITDTQSGFEFGDFTFTSPSGHHFAFGNFGTPTGSTYPIDITFPQFTEAGVWHLSDLSLTDNQGNTFSVPPGTMPAGATTTITVTDTNADSVAPALGSVGVSSSTLNVQAAPGTQDVTIPVTDATSGFADGTLVINGPTGATQKQIDFDAADRTSGTANNGTYTVHVPFATNSEPGTYTISFTDLRDIADNSADYSGNAVPGTRTFTVQSTPTTPTPPTDVTGDPGHLSVEVDWSAPADNGGSNITGYTATSSPGNKTCTSTTSTFCTVPGLTDGTSYTFTVTATNAIGTSAPSAPSTSVTPNPTAPGPPASATASAGNAQATVNWTAPTDNGGSAVTGYSITAYLSANDNPVKTDNVGLVLTDTMTGLTNNVSYYFGVRALNIVGIGQSHFTNDVIPTAVNPPGKPTGVTAALNGATGATVSWAAASNGGGTIDKYTVTASPGGQTCVWTTGPLSCTVTGLAKGTTYTFTVVAHNEAGDGLASDPSTGLLIPTTVPGAPTGVAGAQSGATGAAVSWTAPADTGGATITSYTVTASPGGKTCTWTTGPLTCTVTGLAKGQSYTFTVKAHNANGDSAASSPSSSVLIVTTVPDAPINASATQSGATGAAVTWTAPVDNGGLPIDKYTVTASPSGGTCTWTAGPLTCTVPGLTKGVQYTFTVAAHNANGYGASSVASNAVLIAPTAPDAPTGVSASLDDPAATSTSVTVSWTAPADNGGSTITKYTVTASNGGGICTWTSGPLHCTVSGLAKNTAYTFTVTATNSVSAGAASAPSNSVTTGSTVPGAPSGAAATAGPSSAVVSWTAPSDNGGLVIDKYTVSASPGGGATCTWTSGPLHCTVPGLTKGVQYTFTVAAHNANGYGPSSSASNAVTIPTTAPDAPTGVSASLDDPAATSTSVTVSWIAPVDNGGAAITGYTVTASPGGATCTWTTGPLHCTVSGLAKNTAYTFTVTATNPVGTGAASAPSNSVTTGKTVPGAPTAVQATAGDGSAAVSWTAPVDTGGSPITGYTVTASPGGATCTSTTTSCTVSGLTNGTAYTFTVVASSTVGDSAASVASNSVTPSAASKLSITSLSKTTVIFGSAVTVKGKLSNKAGQPLAGQTVKLQYRNKASTGAFKTFAKTATTNAAGLVTISGFKPKQNTQLRLSFDGGGGAGASTSSNKNVSVARAITLGGTASVKKGKKFSLSGKVNPATGGPTAVLQRKSGSRWVHVASATVAANHKYKFTLTAAAKGTFSYRVVVNRDSKFAQSVSNTKTVKVT